MSVHNPKDFFPLLRRCPRVVLWGGRPLDYQFGSDRDKARTQRILRLRKMARNLGQAQERIGIALLPSIKLAVKGMAEFEANMRKLDEALRATDRRKGAA